MAKDAQIVTYTKSEPVACKCALHEASSAELQAVHRPVDVTVTHGLISLLLKSLFHLVCKSRLHGNKRCCY